MLLNPPLFPATTLFCSCVFLELITFTPSPPFLATTLFCSCVFLELITFTPSPPFLATTLFKIVLPLELDSDALVVGVLKGSSAAAAPQITNAKANANMKVAARFCIFFCIFSPLFQLKVEIVRILLKIPQLLKILNSSFHNS